MATLSCLISEPRLLLTLIAARNKYLNLKTKKAFLLKYPVCAINRVIFFTFEWFYPLVA